MIKHNKICSITLLKFTLLIETGSLSSSGILLVSLVKLDITISLLIIFMIKHNKMYYIVYFPFFQLKKKLFWYKLTKKQLGGIRCLEVLY